MNVRSDDPDWADRDRFVLSKGHANAGLSAVLAQKGFFPDAWLDTFYGYESLLGMHPDIKCPGVEMSTGGLGHGLPIGVGMAMGARIQGKSFQTYVMTGDGELHEGSNWEAAMAAAQYRLNNLTCIVDANRVSQSAHVADLVGIEPLADKWRAFGWEVRECDGHSMADVVKTLDELPFNLQKPSLIISHTVKGKGVSFAEDTYLWHSNTVNEEILQKALAELGTP
jgi:transketolase